MPLVDGVRAAGAGLSQFSIARNRSLVYVPGPSGDRDDLSLMWVTRTGEETPTAAPTRNYDAIRVSPDGTRIAAVVDGGDNTDVWVWHLDQGPLTRLTFNEAADFAPLWTLDSSRLVFSSDRDGGGLFWRAADGTGRVEPLLESTSRPQPWGWTLDGRLLFDQAPGDTGVLAIEGERTVEMLLETEFTTEQPALSPDNRWLAYQSNESGRMEVFVQPFPNIDEGSGPSRRTAGLIRCGRRTGGNSSTSQCQSGSWSSRWKRPRRSIRARRRRPSTPIFTHFSALDTMISRRTVNDSSWQEL